MTTTTTTTDLAALSGLSAGEYLRSRGYVQDVTDQDALDAALSSSVVTGYVGYDPTATSLHVGNLVSIMMLAALQRYGHRPIALAGGGTALIGDPSGKTTERVLLTREQVEDNLRAILPQFGRYLRFGDGPGDALLVNNADWLLDLGLIEFLRDIGRHFSVNEMLASDAYRQRLERGLNFVELNYRLLQSYDFLHLHRALGCTLQMGGSDQWGNIVAGVDLVRRVEGATVFGLVSPLITTASGAKMGKTEEGAVWLDAARTAPFDFYQFWINTDDADVARFLRLYTFVPEARIAELTWVEGAALREAKRVLAEEATALTHGRELAEAARLATAALFGQELDELEQADVALAVSQAGAALEVPYRDGLTVAELFVAAGLCASRNDARRLAQQGGLSVNGTVLPSADVPVDAASDVLLLRAGKKRHRYARLVTGG